MCDDKNCRNPCHMFRCLQCGVKYHVGGFHECPDKIKSKDKSMSGNGWVQGVLL